jgi:hypothetical protein
VRESSATIVETRIVIACLLFAALPRAKSAASWIVYDTGFRYNRGKGPFEGLTRTSRLESRQRKERKIGWL